LYEIQKTGHANQRDINAILFKLCRFNHSKPVGVQTSEVDAKLAPVNVGLWNFVC
jgi:hypothetical protein